MSAEEVRVHTAWLMDSVRESLRLHTVGPDGIVRTTTLQDPAGGRPDPVALAEEEARRSVQQYLTEAGRDVAWDDVQGNEAARQALVEAIEAPVRHAALYASYGMKPPKGVLLCGPPGCGKTMLAKAAASAMARLHGTAGGRLLHIKPADWQTPFWGQTERIITAIFAYARAYKARYGHPLVILMDEADAALPSRSGTIRRPLPWEESQVATFLAEMDGLQESAAFVILATNRPEAIDAAVLRDGRCDRRIVVERPSRDDFATILRRSLLPVAPTQAASVATRAVAAIFDRERRLRSFVTNDGRQGHLTLGDLVSGAMAEGLAQRIRAQAFRRDLAAGAAEASGLAEADVLAAVEELAQESRALPHVEAMIEVGTRMGAEWVRPTATQVVREPAISREEQRRMMN